MYTIKTIKKTKVYLANVEKVRKIWPDHVEDFAHELMVAANSFDECQYKFSHDEPCIGGAFIFAETPQGEAAWWSFYMALSEA